MALLGAEKIYGGNKVREVVPTGHRSAFTLLELLVVLVVISILVGAVLTASSVFITQQRVKNTRLVLQIVRDALEQFKEEQKSKPTITSIVQGTAANGGNYLKRYGQYPPDELEVYTPYGIPGAAPPSEKYSLARNAAMIPPCSASAAYASMKFHSSGTEIELEHRDLAAMLLTVQLFSESADQILSRIPERNWSPGAVNAAGTPIQFLDRLVPAGAAGAVGMFGSDDEQIRYLIDDWNVPLSYLAQRDWLADARPPNRPQAPPSTNLPGAWNQASTELIRLNGGRPIIFSYGPNGPQQLTRDAMGDTGNATLVADWVGMGIPTNDPGVIDLPLNADNIYTEESFGEKIAKRESE